MTQVLTIQQLKKNIVTDLESFMDIREAQSVTKIILDHLGFAESRILANPDTPVEYQIRSEVNKITAQLHLHRPIQYILGATEFYGHQLKVNESVLIPRQETELLVHQIIAEHKNRKLSVLDLGTGSGCIAIALKTALTGAEVYATDISADALSVARLNATTHLAEITFSKHDMLSGTVPDLPAPMDLIVSNPPYVTQEEKLQMEDNVLKYEPWEALFVPSEDPLRYYHAIMDIADHVLKPDGQIWVEINEKYAQTLINLLIKAGFANTELIRDLNGKDRFIKACRP